MKPHYTILANGELVEVRKEVQPGLVYRWPSGNRSTVGVRMPRALLNLLRAKAVARNTSLSSLIIDVLTQEISQ